MKISIKRIISIVTIAAMLIGFMPSMSIASESAYPYLLGNYNVEKPSVGGALQILDKNGTMTLCDQSGKPIQLRGMSTHGLQWFPGIINDNAIAAISNDWGCNVIRLAMYIGNDGYATDPGIKQYVINGINEAIAHDMYVIVDWHMIIPGDPNASIYSGAMDFFREISSMYPDNKNIIYELCNEPNGNSPGVTNDAAGWMKVKSYAAPIIQMLRSSGNNNLIIVGDPNWCQRPDLAADNPIDDSNTMYTAHFYAGTHQPWYDDTNRNNCMSNIRYALEHHIAVFVTEWGTSQSSGGGGTYTDASDIWLNFLNQNNISWCNWSLSNPSESSGALNIAASLDPGTDQVWAPWELSLSGEYVRARIKGIPYVPINRSTAYNVNAANLSHGTITASPAAAPAGTVINLTAMPDMGYELKAGSLKYNDGTSDIPIDGTSFIMPASNVTVSAEFEKITYSVNIGNLAYGTITASPASAVQGTTINLTVMPDSGYELKAGSLKYNDGVSDKTINGTSFIMPDSNVTVIGEFQKSVSGVSLNTTAARLKIGDYMYITATVDPPDAGDHNLIWTSSDSGVAAVDNTGKVTGIGNGTAEITATTEDGGYSASCIVTVYKAVTGVSLDKTTASIRIGDNIILTAAVDPSDAADKNINWITNDPSIATVDNTGKVTGTGKGTAAITAVTEDGGYWARCFVTVTVPVSGISLDKNAASLKIGDIIYLTATVNPSDAFDKNLTWTSNDTSVATVDNTGKVTAAGKGTAKITVTTEDGGYSASCTVTVTKPVTGVSLNKTTASLKIGDIMYLTAAVSPSDASDKNLVWVSSNPFAAAVDNTGKVTAAGKGTAEITATTEDGGYSASCTVTVTKPVTGVSLDKTTANLKTGDVLNLTATVNPSDASDNNLTWSSSDTSVAEVDNTGKVTAVGKGTAKITVTTEDGGYSAGCTVTVTKPVTGVSLDKTTASLKIGDVLNLTATVSPSDASDQNLIWVSGDPFTATVDNTGKVTAAGKGTTEITVTTEDGGYSAGCTVTVTDIGAEPVKGVSLDKTRASLKVGNSLNLIATISPSDASDKNLTWSSSNESVTKVDDAGKVTAVGKGTAVITVTTEDGGYFASCAFNVTGMDTQVVELIGSDRYDTAARLSKNQFQTADTVIIVNGGGLADGLGATPLGAYKKAPILLTIANSVPQTTKNEIKRLNAKNVIIIGGTEVVSNNVVTQLKASGITHIERIGGTDRYDTSLEIAKYIDNNCYRVNNIVVSNGVGEADALSIASAAGRDNMPIILVKQNEIPAKTYSWLTSKNLKNAYIIGGTGVIADSVLNKINKITSDDITNNRLGGKDRFETNSLVIDKFYGNVLNKIYIANGLSLVDALSSGPVAAIDGDPVVLAGNDLSIQQKSVLSKRCSGTVIRTGGGVPDKAVNSLVSCLL